MPEYTMPMFGQITETLSNIESSMRIDEAFFSVAMTMPLVASRRGSAGYLHSREPGRIPLMPRLVVPCETAARACSICTSLPLGEKTVRE